MTLPRLIPLLVFALVPLAAFSQSSPVASQSAVEPNEPPKSRAPASQTPDAAELTKLLKEFLAGASSNDVAMHDRFWADDLIYTGSSGRRIGKADIMRDVRKEAAEADTQKADAETTIYTAEDIRIQQYGTTAIVAFRLVGTTKKGDRTEVVNYLNSGTFLKRDGNWQVVNWQATKMPAEEPPKN